MIAIAICDDDKRYADSITEQVTAISIRRDLDADIRTYYSGGGLYEDIEKGACFDIVFLDIMLGAENGIETAKRAHELCPDTIFVFLTGYADFARQGYEARAFRYLLKGGAEAELERTLMDAVNEMNKIPSFTFSYKHTLYRVSTRDILYFESDKRLVVVHTSGRDYQFYGKLGEAEELTGFIRVHRSYLVNPEKITALSATAVTLTDGTELTVSESYADEAKRKFMLYI